MSAKGSLPHNDLRRFIKGTSVHSRQHRLLGMAEASPVYSFDIGHVDLSAVVNADNAVRIVGKNELAGILSDDTAGRETERPINTVLHRAR